jgi:hypothetical protein
MPSGPSLYIALWLRSCSPARTECVRDEFALHGRHEDGPKARLPAEGPGRETECLGTCFFSTLAVPLQSAQAPCRHPRVMRAGLPFDWTQRDLRSQTNLLEHSLHCNAATDSLRECDRHARLEQAPAATFCNYRLTDAVLQMRAWYL